MKKLILFLFIFSGAQLFAQDKYIVFLKDKANNPYTLSNPDEFLSQRAIDRRNTMGISLDLSDLPHTPAYLDGIRNTGAIILNKSKWLNTVTIQANDVQAQAIVALPYINTIRKVYGTNVFKSGHQNKFEKMGMSDQLNFDLSHYGESFNQLNMLKANLLHDQNYMGQGMVIAVIDAGFNTVNTHTAFEYLRNSGRILGTYDFVRNDPYIYGFHTHGTNVLSLMAAKVADTMIGLAPEAGYYLLRSEDAATEYIIEEYNWAAAAEYADSVGADIINTSLGYTTFDAPSQSHTYADMDGNTTPITIAADFAASKGMLVVNSAGNSGNDSWFYISAPADGDSVFAVGAVQPDRMIAGFSSRGPTSDQRIKPDVSAQGAPAFVAYGLSGFGFGSGTSFSSPIIAGFSACVWPIYRQAYPNNTAYDFMQFIKANSDRSANPDNEYGYGIPDAMQILFSLNVPIHTTKENNFRLYPNPTSDDHIHLDYFAKNEEIVHLSIFSLQGKLITEQEQTLTPLALNRINLFLPGFIKQGMYIVKIETIHQTAFSRFIKF